MYLRIVSTILSLVIGCGGCFCGGGDYDDGIVDSADEIEAEVSVPAEPVTVMASCSEGTTLRSQRNLFDAVTTSGSYSGTDVDLADAGLNAFDGDKRTLWISELNEDPAFVAINLAMPVTATHYEVHFANGADLSTRAPRDWWLQGTLNGEPWVTIDDRLGETEWAGTETRTFQISEPGRYAQYRLLVHEDNDSRAPIVVVSIAELLLCG